MLMSLKMLMKTQHRGITVRGHRRLCCYWKCCDKLTFPFHDEEDVNDDDDHNDYDDNKVAEIKTQTTPVYNANLAGNGRATIAGAPTL